MGRWNGGEVLQVGYPVFHHSNIPNRRTMMRAPCAHVTDGDSNAACGRNQMGEGEIGRRNDGEVLQVGYPVFHDSNILNRRTMMRAPRAHHTTQRGLRPQPKWGLERSSCPLLLLILLLLLLLLRACAATRRGSKIKSKSKSKNRRNKHARTTRACYSLTRPAAATKKAPHRTLRRWEPCLNPNAACGRNQMLPTVLYVGGSHV
jgi:hypothetical protein